jgi:hypothetical protein
MHRVAVALAAILSALAVPTFAAAEPASPSPQPATSPQAAAGIRLTDEEIRMLLVGNAYTIDYREGMRLTMDVHPDGTVHGYVSEGMGPSSRYGTGASRSQDDGKYTIGKGLFCLTWDGAWANKTGKPSCTHITRTETGYLIGTTRMTVTPGKH